MNRPYQKILRKWIEVVEIEGEAVMELQPGQRVIDSRIIHEVVELKQPGGIGGPSVRTHSPRYKTVIVLECVEYEDAAK